MGKSTISMVIFNSYVSLPEGKPPFSYGFSMIFPCSYGFPMVFLWFHHQKLELFIGKSIKNWGKSSENRQDSEIRFPVAGQVRGGFYNMVKL